MIIDKSYTIKYSKSGVYQYAKFQYVKEKLVNYSFSPQWVSQKEIPSLEGLNEIEDILKVIKEFSYNHHAEIYLINGVFPEYYNNLYIEGSLAEYSKDFTQYIEKLSIKFFNAYLYPILRRNKWKISYSWCGRIVLIVKNNKEWTNVDSQHKDYKLVEYMCHKFLYEVMNINEEISDMEENGYFNSENFAIFTKYLPMEVLKTQKQVIIL